MTNLDGWDAYLYRGKSDFGLVVIHEVYGLKDLDKSIASELATSSGYSTAAVDFYKGKKAASIDDARKLRETLSTEDILSAINSGLNMLKKHAGAKKLGVLGFCMGGGFALLGACKIPEITCCVDYYGMIDNAEDVSNLNGPVLLILGSEDARISTWAFNTFLPAAMKYRKRVETHLYPNAKHAFHNKEDPAKYNEAAAKDAWSRTLEFLSRVR